MFVRFNRMSVFSYRSTLGKLTSLRASLRWEAGRSSLSLRTVAA
jgi:hypothetical protein